MAVSALLTGALIFFMFYGSGEPPVLIAGAAGLALAGFAAGRGLGDGHTDLLSIDRLAQSSRLNSCHSGVKLCLCTASALLCVAADSPPVSLFVAISMLAVSVGVGGTPLRRYLQLLGAPLSFITLGAAAVLFEFSPTPMGLLDLPVAGHWLCVTPHTQRQALGIVTRALGAVGCLYLLGLSTPMHRIVAFLRKIKTPAVVVELMYLIYRYLFVLLETQQQLQTAAASRLGYRGAVRSLRTALSTSRNLLALSFRRSSDCFAAMESRCYDGELSFWEEETPVRAGELAAAAGYLSVVALLWVVTGRLQL